MSEKPILFSGPMVRAILENRKTMTRRVVKFPKHTYPADWVRSVCQDGGGNWIAWSETTRPDLAEFTKKAYPNGEGFPCPYGTPGDRLWVRETWQKYQGTDYIHYRADGEQALMVWRPSIHMPRWASRLTLEITGVKVERVQDISGADAVAEGVTVYSQADLKGYDDAIGGARIASLGIESAAVKLFAELWDSINGKHPGYSWQDNPWVFAISFKRVTA